MTFWDKWLEIGMSLEESGLEQDLPQICMHTHAHKTDIPL